MSAIKKFSFPKAEKLCSEKAIQDLFKNGQSVFLFPYKIYYVVAKKTQEHESQEKNRTLPQILISVPKKNFKRAVDRNRIKRKIREAYRLCRHTVLMDHKEAPVFSSIAIVYVAKENISFHSLQEKLILILFRLISSRKI